MSASDDGAAGSDVMSCIDVAALARPGVDVRQWVNGALARLLLLTTTTPSDTTTVQQQQQQQQDSDAMAAVTATAERVSTRLYHGLQRHAHDVSSAIEELTAQTVMRLPRTTLELERMVSDTHALAAQLQQMRASVQPAVEAEGAAVVRALNARSRAAQTLRYCSTTLDKAARVDAAMAALDAATRRLRAHTHTHTHTSSSNSNSSGRLTADMADVDATAEAIRGVQRDLAALREVESAYGEKQRAALARYAKLVEDALEDECASCLRGHDAERAARLLHTLHTIGRIDAVLQRYTHDAVAGLVAQMQRQLQQQQQHQLPPSHDDNDDDTAATATTTAQQTSTAATMAVVSLTTAAQVLPSHMVPAMGELLHRELDFACALAQRIDAAAAHHGRDEASNDRSERDDDTADTAVTTRWRRGDTDAAALSHTVMQMPTTMIELLHEAFAAVMTRVLRDAEGAATSNDALLRCYDAVRALRVHGVSDDGDDDNDEGKMRRAAAAHRMTTQLVRAFASVFEADDVVSGFVARATQSVAAQLHASTSARTSTATPLPSARRVDAVLSAVVAGVRAAVRFVPERTLAACADAWLPLLCELLTPLQPPHTSSSSDGGGGGAQTSPVRLLQHMVVATRVVKPALLTCQTQLNVYLTTTTTTTSSSVSNSDRGAAAAQSTLHERVWQPLLTRLEACVTANEQAVQQYLLQPVLAKAATYTTLPVWSHVAASATGAHDGGHATGAATTANDDRAPRQGALAAYAVGHAAPTQAVRDLGEAIMEIPLALDALRSEAAMAATSSSNDDDDVDNTSNATADDDGGGGVHASREAVTRLLEEVAESWLDDMVCAVARYFVSECVLRVRVRAATPPRGALEQLVTDMAYLRNVLAAVSDDAFAQLERVLAWLQTAMDATTTTTTVTHEHTEATCTIADLLARVSGTDAVVAASAAALHAPECFDVLTSADGAHTLTLTLSCATPLEHYTRTTASRQAPHGNNNDNDDDDDVCSTGLRVYEGAQLLAAFVAQYGACLLPQQRQQQQQQYASLSLPSRSVLELGCGCALVGFTVAHTLPCTRVVFTDAAVDCLAHVRASGAAMHMTVRDVTCRSSDDDDDAAATHCTYPLRWSDASVDALLRRLQQRQQQHVSLDMLVGSDLMYYRVDMDALLRTCARLLRATADDDDTTCDGGRDAFVVLAHAMRVAGGRVQLARTARRYGFAVAAVALDAFVCGVVVQSMGWSSLELVLLLPRRRPRARCCATCSDNDDHDKNDVRAAQAVAADDVRVVRDALLRRCSRRCVSCARAPRGDTHDDNDAVAGSSDCDACKLQARQAATLCAYVTCYPTDDSDVCNDNNDDEAALLRVLL